MKKAAPKKPAQKPPTTKTPVKTTAAKTTPAKTTPAKTTAAKTTAAAALAARFGLGDDERRVLELVRAADELTVRELRARVAGVDALLSPKRALRRHALVTVGDGGLPSASDRVRLAPGVAQRLDGAPEPDALWLGMCRVAPGGRGDLPARIAAVFGELGGAAATLLTLDGCGRRETHELALGLGRHLGRGVLVVDGELAADAPDAALLLACARREADCEGDVLVVCEAGALGERWRALLAPPAGEAMTLVVLADAERTRDPVAASSFSVRRLSLHAPVAAPPAAEPRVEDKPAPPVDDGLDHIRQQAIRDAERALGIYRAQPPPHSIKPAVEPAPPPRISPAAPPPPPPTSAGKRSAKGAQYFGGEAAERPAASPPPAPSPPAPSPPPPPPVDAAALAGDGTPIALTADAAPDELARVAMTSPSAAQRIELINRLRTIKSAPVVAALRANAANQHPAVRAAAEAAMAQLFGPNWNATRPIPKPVQPPPSDDKDRGPPGGW